jgi:hypothetical protein
MPSPTTPLPALNLSSDAEVDPRAPEKPGDFVTKPTKDAELTMLLPSSSTVGS